MNEDIIAGLQNKKDAAMRHNTPYVAAQDKPRGPLADNSKGTRHGLTRATMGAIMVVTFAVGTCTGAGFYAAGSPKPDKQVPQAPPQVNVTVIAPANHPVSSPVAVNPAQPDTCIKAVQQALRILEASRVVASASNKQIDFMSEAYVAIATKDVQRINAVITKMRALDAELSDPRLTALPTAQEVKDGLATCHQ